MYKRLKYNFLRGLVIQNRKIEEKITSNVLIFQKWSWTITTPFKIYVTLSFNEHVLRETKLRFEKSVNSEIWKSEANFNCQKTILQKTNSTNFVNGVIFQIRCYPSFFKMIFDRNWKKIFHINEKLDFLIHKCCIELSLSPFRFRYLGAESRSIAL